MTASEEAKKNGFKSLTEVAKMTGYTTQWLRDKYKDNYALFLIILSGCIVKKLDIALCDIQKAAAEKPKTIGDLIKQKKKETYSDSDLGFDHNDAHEQMESFDEAMGRVATKEAGK